MEERLITLHNPKKLRCQATIVSPNGTIIGIFPQGDNQWVTTRSILQALGFNKYDSAQHKQLRSFISGNSFRLEQRFVEGSTRLTFVCDLKEIEQIAKAAVAEYPNLTTKQRKKAEQFLKWATARPPIVLSPSPDALRIIDIDAQRFCSYTLSANGNKVKIFSNGEGRFFVTSSSLLTSIGYTASSGKKGAPFYQDSQYPYGSKITIAAASNGIPL